jgi:hypothetical protein
MASGIWDPGIGIRSSSGPATVSDTPVPAALTEALGVLRRPATAQDRSAEVEATLRGAVGADGVRPDSARYLAAGVPGEATVLLSSESVNPVFTDGQPLCVFRPHEVGGQIPAGCFGADQLLSGEATATLIDERTGAAIAYGMGPDGVATVTAKFGSAPDRTIPVANNYWEMDLSGAELSNANGESSVQGTVWRDANGAVVAQRLLDGRQGNNP